MILELILTEVKQVMQTERQELWRSTHLLTEDKKDLARIVLEEIRRGRDVTKTLRSHPLHGGRISQQIHAGGDLQ